MIVSSELTKFGERLSHLAQENGGITNLSKRIGVTRQQFTRWAKGEASPSFETMVALSRETKSSLDWLATGEGGAIVWPEGDSYALLPKYAVEASAGTGLVPISEEITEHLAFRREWLSELGLNPGQVALVTAAGDSMSPTIPNGAIMLVDISINQVRDGCIYVIVLDGDLLVKRVRRHLDGTVDLTSDNPDAPDNRLTAEELDKLHIAGRVRWIGHTV